MNSLYLYAMISMTEFSSDIGADVRNQQAQSLLFILGLTILINVIKMAATSY